MAKKTISELDDGAATQTSAAEVAFEEGSATFRGPVRPNPVNQINVRNQAQLEAELGVNLEIPDGTNVTIAVDDSFTLTTSIKVGNGAGLELIFSNIGPVVSWTGTGAMIQNIVPGVDESSFLGLQNVNVSGDTMNSFVDITIDSFGFVTITGVNLDNLASIGTLNSPVVAMTRLTGFGITQGLVFTNSTSVNIDNMVVGNFSATNTTWLSVIPSTSSLITINNATASNSVADGDTLFFLDPNGTVGTSFVITSSAITDTLDEGIFYQLGSDIDIDSVTNNGGIAQFVTTPAHELEVGTPVVISDYIVNTAYNGTFVVTAVPTAMTFETGVAFGTNEVVGMMNKSSLDQTSILVTASGNSDSPDSKNIGSMVVVGNTTDTTISTSDVFQDINLGGNAVEASNIEQWTLTNTTTGEMQYDGIANFEGVLAATLVFEPNSSSIFQVRMVVNGSPTSDAVVSKFGISGTVVTLPLVVPLSVVTGDLVKLEILEESATDNPLITDMSFIAQNPN